MAHGTASAESANASAVETTEEEDYNEEALICWTRLYAKLRLIVDATKWNRIDWTVISDPPLTYGQAASASMVQVITTTTNKAPPVVPKQWPCQQDGRRWCW